MLAAAVTSGSSADDQASVEVALQELLRELMLFHRGLARGMGLTLQQAMLLKILEVEGPKQPSQIASLFGISRPAVSVELSSLERNGWLTRNLALGNRRARVIALTPKAARALRAAQDARRAFVDGGVGGLTPSERREFARVLRTFVARLREQRGAGRTPLGGLR